MQRIEHFNLPEHTNELYTKEAISSISLTRDVANKINELIDAYNTLSEMDITWKQEQEGTIRKGVLYMKDNLLNSLHDLMVLLRDSGFIDDRIKFHCESLSEQLTAAISGLTQDDEVINARVDYSGKTDKTLGEGLRRQFKELFSQMVNENLFKLKNISFGYLQNDGTLTAKQSDYSVVTTKENKRFEITSDFIEVNPDCDYYLKYHNTDTINDLLWFRIVSYDKDKNVIGAVDREEYNDYKFKPSYNVKYVRISYRSYLRALIKFERSTYATPLLESFKNEIESLDDMIFNGFVESSSGILCRPQAFIEKMSPVLECSGNENYQLFSWGVYDSWYRITFYDSQYLVISDESLYFNNILNKMITTPENAKYIRVSIRSKDMRMFMFVKESNPICTQNKEFFTSLCMNKPHDFTPLKSIAHRGYCTEAPENTLPAFKKAVEKGFKYLECDVVITKDGIPVLHHDDTVDRTSDHSGNVRDFTYTELYQMDFGYKNMFGDAFAGTKIMTLNEFMNFARNTGIHPYIELKSGIDAEGIKKCVDIVKLYGMINHSTFISFSKTELLNVLEECPYARIGYVYDTITQEVITQVLNLMTPYNHVFIDTNYLTLTEDAINWCKAINVPIEVYTVNDADAVLTLNPYVNGVTSDCLKADEILMNEVI